MPSKKEMPCAAATEQSAKEIKTRVQDTAEGEKKQEENYPGAKYPNLLAEYRATGYALGTLCDHANVTKELMLAILNGEEEPTLAEMNRLYGLFSGLGGYSGYSFGYLCSPVLAVVHPRSHKGITRARALYESLDRTLEAAGKWGLSEYNMELLRRAIKVLDELQSGHTVTYAEYRRALINANFVYKLIAPKQRRDIAR